jgi:hypothetical protein
MRLSDDIYSLELINLMQHQITGSDVTKKLIFKVDLLNRSPLRLYLLFPFRLSSLASSVNIFTAYISLILVLS